MSLYEEKKQARKARLEARIARLDAFAKGKDLSLYGEEKSGIPMGQPILVGHHSEKRHRKHLERIERLVRAGYDASAKADRLRERLANEYTGIQVDNPDAKQLILDKIKGLEDLIKSTKDSGNYSSWQITNRQAEIRRLKKRLIELDRIEESRFEPFYVGLILVELKDGQIQVEFQGRPSDEMISKLKSSPLALKWSRYSKRWVRKHTGTTASYGWIDKLKSALEGDFKNASSK